MERDRFTQISVLMLLDIFAIEFVVEKVLRVETVGYSFVLVLLFKWNFTTNGEEWRQMCDTFEPASMFHN